eukprot:1505892-Pleurochrysis_carterae.AAC.3
MPSTSYWRKICTYRSRLGSGILGGSSRDLEKHVSPRERASAACECATPRCRALSCMCSRAGSASSAPDLRSPDQAPVEDSQAEGAETCTANASDGRRSSDSLKRGSTS